VWSARPTYFVANFLHPNDLSVTLGFDQICSLRTKANRITDAFGPKLTRSGRKTPQGAFGMVFTTRKDDGKRGARILKHGLWIGGFGVLVLWALITVGRGGGSSTPNRQHASTVMVKVTGTSGSISHTTPVTLTIQ